MSRLDWYLRRLRAMSGREMLWRADRLRQRVTAGRVTWESAGAAVLGGQDPAVLLDRFRKGTDRPVLLDHTRAALIAAEHPEQVAAVVAAAERVLDGQVRFFGYPPVSVGDAIDWNFDAQHRMHWPSASSARIDHRTAAGDAKWIWELNRLQHLPWLAQAWLFTGEERFAEGAFAHLDSWIEQQPPGAGIAWRGAFECGIRAISVAIAVQGLRDAPRLTVARYESYIVLLGESARRCWAERSLFSSANNHLIGELAGLAVVAILLPELPAARRWERDALAQLAVHADRQLLPDGSGAEQAIAYQLFTAELLGIVHALLVIRDGASVREEPLGRAAQRDTPLDRREEPNAQRERLGAAIERSSRYLALLVGDNDPQPRYGDDDGGFALRLGPEHVRTVRDHLGIANALIPNPAAARAGSATITAAWLGTATVADSPGARFPSPGAELPSGDAEAPSGDSQFPS
ncbi:heparinase II/III family protein, partial [Nocardia jejuensis]|uniref:heparinase II/III family protein n=1 Tax=Nocardia jejuensis TaxID=328049 RepID=UPI000A461ED5